MEIILNTIKATVVMLALIYFVAFLLINRAKFAVMHRKNKAKRARARARAKAKANDLYYTKDMLDWAKVEEGAFIE